jgi:hypothetical protein
MLLPLVALQKQRQQLPVRLHLHLSLPRCSCPPTPPSSKQPSCSPHPPTVVVAVVVGEEALRAPAQLALKTHRGAHHPWGGGWRSGVGK